MFRPGWWGIGLAACIAVAGFNAARAAALPTAPDAVHLLDVPYVPQSAALCGGAALAMVFRYWGDPSARAEDFTGLLTPDGRGIRADSLVAAVRARGWVAIPLTGSESEARAQLAQGRPVIALVHEHAEVDHYVVLVAWANGGVILHDPARAPFRVSDARAFDQAWAGSGRWALVVLPPPGVRSEPADSTVAPPPALTGCDAIVDDAVARAHAGDPAGAERQLRSALALCPLAAAPWRGLAGLRFAAKDWSGAARLSERALACDPGDAYTWRLLAASRYLLADEPAALRAWNRVSEPHTNLARVDGLVRTRYDAVAGQLALPPGPVLTARAYVRAQRRLAEIPAPASARLRLRPLAGGSAQLDVAVLERPLVFDGALAAGGTGVRALFARDVLLRVASPTGHGELWSAGGSWRRARPMAALGLDIPAGGGHPGIWHVAGSWERQSYASTRFAAREERNRSALAFSDWIAPFARLETGVALDRWSGRGSHVGLAARGEWRGLADRVALVAAGGQWTSLARGAPFRSGSVEARVGPRPPDDAGWTARAGLFGASATAPLALWPGAGTGSGRSALLRAHPLLDRGVVSGRAFGRALADVGVERAVRLGSVHAVRVGASAFVDAAHAWRGLPGATATPWLVDGGVSLRLALPGVPGAFRVAGAHGFVDGRAALSCAFGQGP